MFLYLLDVCRRVCVPHVDTAALAEWLTELAEKWVEEDAMNGCHLGSFAKSKLVRRPETVWFA